MDEPGCRWRKREYFTYGEAETEDSDSGFGGSDGEGKEEEVVEYCNGVRVDDLCS